MNSCLRAAFALVVGLCLTMPAHAFAGDNIPPRLQHLGVTEHLDAQLPLDANFRDEEGKPVRLGDFFGTKPAVVVLAYHSCPTFCGMVLRGLSESLTNLPWTLGNEYQTIVVSIDPRDKPEAAAEKRKIFYETYGRGNAGAHFLVGEKGQIDRVASALGFEYEFNKDTNQYQHPAVVFVAKPSGGIARYLYGVTYETKDLRLSLLEAAHEKSLTTGERLLLFCFHYDPNEGKYVLLARRVMQLAGAVTAVLLAGFLTVMWRRERTRSNGTEPNGEKPAGPSSELKEAT